MTKHRAGSPLESTAKRGRHDLVVYQSSELVSQSARSYISPVPMTYSLPMASTENFGSSTCFNPMNEARDFTYSGSALQLDVPEWFGNITGTEPYYIEPASMNQGIGMLPTLAPVSPVDLYAPTQVYKLSLKDNKPADFLAIRETQGRRSC